MLINLLQDESADEQTNAPASDGNGGDEGAAPAGDDAGAGEEAPAGGDADKGADSDESGDDNAGDTPAA